MQDSSLHDRSSPSFALKHINWVLMYIYVLQSLLTAATMGEIPRTVLPFPNRWIVHSMPDRKHCSSKPRHTSVIERDSKANVSPFHFCAKCGVDVSQFAHEDGCPYTFRRRHSLRYVARNFRLSSAYANPCSPVTKTCTTCRRQS